MMNAYVHVGTVAMNWIELSKNATSACKQQLSNREIMINNKHVASFKRSTILLFHFIQC